MEKRGLSNIMVTLLIIVLSLVAVSVVWGVVRDIISEGTEQIELGKFTLDLEIKSVKVQGDDVTVDVIVQRNPGPGEFIGINFVFSDGTNSEVIREDIILKELDEKSFTFSLTKIKTSELEDVSIAPIYELRSGKEDMGNIADKFSVKKTITAGVTMSNFDKLGFKGAGKREYSISSQSEDVVKFIKAIVDPLDVLPGDNQTFTVHVYSPNNITEVTTTTELDNSTLNLDLEEIGEENGNQIFSATWIVNDVHAITYRTHIVATDSEGNSNTITLTWTDSCQSQINHGTDSTISTSCSTGTSAIAGIDGGSLTIAAGVTLTIDSGAQLIFNQGESITITASGASIVSTSTGSFGNGLLYYTDVDQDGYAISTTLKTTSSSAVRAKDALGTSDCLDSDADTYQQLSNLELDSDRDRYSSTGPGSACVGDKSSFWWMHQNGVSGWINTLDVLGTDCVDTNAFIWRNVLNLGLDVDKDRYSTGGTATRCVGVKTSFWYKDADGTDKWISTTDDLGTFDCNDNDATTLDPRWDSPVQIGSCCEVTCGGQDMTGVSCTPENSTRIWGDFVLVVQACGFGNDDDIVKEFEQTCTC